jgi:hypothetical protein
MENAITDLVIPEGAEIGQFAFHLNKIKSLNLPDTLTEIPYYAFYGNKLTELVLPKGLKTIVSYAFARNAITDLVIPEGARFGEWAFWGNKLKTVTMPGAMTSVPGYAFYENELTSITLHDGIKSIGSKAFMGNNNITEIRIGKLVEFATLPFGDKSPCKNFLRYYRNHGCAAGIYRYTTKWTYEEEKGAKT